MTTTQKNIKTIAIIVGVMIIVAISTLILSGIGLFLDFTDKSSRDDGTKVNLSYDDVTKITVELESTNLELVEGQEFKIEKFDTKDNLQIEVVGETLKIVERSRFFWNSSLGGTIVVYVPQNAELSDITIDIGAGKVKMNSIEAKTLDLDQGAGSVDIENSIFDETDIDGGAGSIKIKDSTLKNLDLNSGVGSIDISAKILGRSDIDAGVGSIDIDIDGYKEDYTIEAEKGLGSIKVDGVDLSGKTGTGPNTISIEGGVGSIKVDFND